MQTIWVVFLALFIIFELVLSAIGILSGHGVKTILMVNLYATYMILRRFARFLFRIIRHPLLSIGYYSGWLIRKIVLLASFLINSGMIIRYNFVLAPILSFFLVSKLGWFKILFIIPTIPIFMILMFFYRKFEKTFDHNEEVLLRLYKKIFNFSETCWERMNGYTETEKESADEYANRWRETAKESTRKAQPNTQDNYLQIFYAKQIKLLGLEGQDITRDNINHAHRIIAKKYHPENCTDPEKLKECEEKMRECSQAAKTLLNAL